MNDPRPQLALRKLRAHLAHPATLVVILGVSAVLAVAGPFDTADAMPLVPRSGYWLAIVTLSYAFGFLVSEAFSGRRDAWPLAAVILVPGVIIGLGVSVLVVVINFFALGYVPAQGEWPGFLGAIMAISVIVTAMTTILGAQNHGSAGARAATAPPALLERLAVEKRGPLQALTVEDHYVRVQTTKGEEMLLMRLSDAMKEVGATPGAQVHRSHWVAWAAVRAARREGDRAILTLGGGREIPVSRANVGKLKQAGVLPK